MSVHRGTQSIEATCRCLLWLPRSEHQGIPSVLIAFGHAVVPKEYQMGKQNWSKRAQEVIDESFTFTQPNGAAEYVAVSDMSWSDPAQQR